MSDVATSPLSGGEGEPLTVITPAADTPQKLSTREAAQVLAAARRSKHEQAATEAPPEPVSASEAESAAPLEEAPGEDVTATHEPAEQPPIEPPRSWTKDAKERWQSLPRETQEYLAAREQERDREVRRSQNEAAEQRKSIDTTRAEAERVKQDYETKLATLVQTLHDASPFHDIKTVADVEKMQAEDPFRFQQFQLHQWKVQAAQQELQQAESRKVQEAQSQWAEHVQKENTLFAESLSEADKGKLKQLMDAAPEFLESKGFTNKELTELASGKDKLSIYDHRVQSLILDGMKYREAQKAKTVKTSNPVPQVQKPGVAAPKGAGSAQEIQALETQLHGASGVNALRIAAKLAGARRSATR